MAFKEVSTSNLALRKTEKTKSSHHLDYVILMELNPSECPTVSFINLAKANCLIKF